ncbi:MAG TPA: outer membrane beta-barrel protein [Puia sp.]|nr:outer membrane beta-barrel protein [Puia sp.]
MAPDLKKVLLILCFTVGVVVGYTQDKGFVEGRVRAGPGQPIPAATVTLVNVDDPTEKKTEQTDTAGRFLFEGIPYGQFTCRITHAGYLPVTRDSIVITPISGTINLGDLTLIPSSELLTEAIVSAKNPTLRAGQEKKVFSVNQSLVSTGGSAIDLLQNVPTLQVDASGNVSLRGATNLKVLVDGKRSLIGDGSIPQVLQSLPASAIDRVEIITNPSAKYDAEGQALINIVLKKNSIAGSSGSVAVTEGTRDNYNAAVTMGYQNSRINAYGNYSYQRRNTYSNGIQNMTFLSSPGDAYYSDETFPSTTIVLLHSAKAGFEYSATARDVVTVSGSYNASSRNRSERLTVDNLTADRAPVVLSTRQNGTTGHADSYEAALDLTHKFRQPQQELTIDLDYSRGITHYRQLYATDVYDLYGQPADSTASLQDSKESHTRNYNIQLDFTSPAGKSGKWEGGYRSQISIEDNSQWDANFNATSGDYAPDYTLINRFTSNSQVHAAYLTYRRQIHSFSFQVGLRGEIGRFHANLSDFDSTGKPAVTPIAVNTQGLYPSLLLKEQIGEGRQLQVSYSRRVNRPTPQELNPFSDVSDPVNYDEGNPRLLPEDLHSIELVFSRTWPKASLTSGLYYNLANHVIKHIQTGPVNDVVITIAENLRRAVNTGIELIGTVRPVKGWDFTTNVNLFDRINDGDSAFGIRATQGFSWNINLTNNFSLTRDLAIQLRADYKAPELIIQDRYRAAWGIDGGARYELWHHKGSLAFNARDIFNTRRPAFLRVSDDLLLDWHRITYSARASLTFTWRFGHNDAGGQNRKGTEDQPVRRIENR